MNPPDSVIHPVWLRVTHWLNVLAVVLMVMSGWRIFNASPFWGLAVVRTIRLAQTSGPDAGTYNWSQNGVIESFQSP